MRFFVAALLMLPGCLLPPDPTVRPVPESEGPADYSRAGQRGQFGISELQENFIRNPDHSWLLMKRVPLWGGLLAQKEPDWCTEKYIIGGTATDHAPCPSEDGFGPLIKSFQKFLTRATRKRCPGRCPTARYQEIYSEWKCAGTRDNQPVAMIYLELRCGSGS